MPLKWTRGHNPYRDNLFQVLRVGPQAKPPQIVAQGNNLRRQLEADAAGDLARTGLSVQRITEASNLLRQERPRAEELLLAHWPAIPSPEVAGTSKGIQELVQEIIENALLPLVTPEHGTACLHFVPAPESSIVPIPPSPELVRQPIAADATGPDTIEFGL